MTARGPNGQVASNSGALTLFGSKATDATSPSLQPLPGGGIMAKVDIPINVDWAESSVTFSVETSQGVGGDNPNWESCRTPQENVDLNLTVCSEPLWENSATLTGPDLSAVNAGITLPAAIDKTEFALFVLPAMEFQLPVLRVAIVYAPLGNGKSALPHRPPQPR